MYKRCPKCNINNEEYAEFCTNCGKKFSENIKAKKLVVFERIDTPKKLEVEDSSKYHNRTSFLKKLVAAKATTA